MPSIFGGYRAAPPRPIDGDPHSYDSRMRWPLATGNAEAVHEWERYGVGWHAVFGGLATLTGALLLIDAPLALTLLAAMVLWYGILGWRGLRREPVWSAPVYLAVAVPLTVGLFVVAPVGALMLFVLYPHVWAMLRPKRAVVVTVGLVTAVTAISVVRDTFDPNAVVWWLIAAAVSLVFALLLGLWIARIIAQSRQRADVLAELDTARAELAAVSREAGALAERERLARDIHDTLAQGFTSVLLLLEAALASDPDTARRQLARARDTARDNLAEARALVAALTPPDLTRTSLPEALRRVVERAAAQPGPHGNLSVTGTPRGLPAEQEVTLLRTAQEALTNVRRHAAAGHVDVSLAYAAEAVSLRVRDDGQGFDPAMPSNGYGLEGMRGRAARIGGVLTISSAPGAGVTVCLEVPA